MLHFYCSYYFSFLPPIFWFGWLLVGPFLLSPFPPCCIFIVLITFLSCLSLPPDLHALSFLHVVIFIIVIIIVIVIIIIQGFSFLLNLHAFLDSLSPTLQTTKAGCEKVKIRNSFLLAVLHQPPSLGKGTNLFHFLVLAAQE